MQIEQRDITTLTEYPGNPRKNDHAVEAVAKAIDTYGFNVPILIKSDGMIIDGHLRYKAAKHLGLDIVPVCVADHLTEDEIKAFRISVNKVAELAKWDESLLKEELLSLKDVDLLPVGFSEADVDAILAIPIENTDRDTLPEPSQKVARLGDLWVLGSHKLFVGDSLDPSSYSSLLGDAHADMVWTDPPYNVDYSGKAGKIKNDKMSEAQFFDFLRLFYANLFNSLKPGGPIYVAHADGQPSKAFRRMFEDAGFYYSTCLIWKKSHSTIGRADYHYKHEPILYGWKPGAAHFWYGGRKRKSVVEHELSDKFTPVDGGGVFTYHRRRGTAHNRGKYHA